MSTTALKHTAELDYIVSLASNASDPVAQVADIILPVTTWAETDPAFYQVGNKFVYQQRLELTARLCEKSGLDRRTTREHTRFRFPIQLKAGKHSIDGGLAGHCLGRSLGIDQPGGLPSLGFKYQRRAAEST